MSTTFYKYRNWKNITHQNALQKNEIYFASPKFLNDPFDSKIHLDLSLLNTEDLKNRFVIQVSDNYELYNPELDIIQWRKKFLHSLTHDFAVVQKTYNQIEANRMNDHVGIYSMSENCLSNLMWSHYANNHKGFCIGYDSSKLKKYCTICKAGLFKVSYPAIFPSYSPIHPNPTRLMIERLAIKSECWEYEKEQRLMRFYPHAANDTERTFNLPDDIKEIVIGLNISSLDKQEILMIGNSRNIPLYEVILIPHTFNLDRHLI